MHAVGTAGAKVDMAGAEAGVIAAIEAAMAVEVVGAEVAAVGAADAIEATAKIQA